MATTSASWRTTAAGRPPTPTGGFNLATTSASWRTSGRRAGSRSTSGLQFGHDVSVVENAVEAILTAAPGPASIWPRRQRRGEPLTARSGRADRRRFNLATTSASWRTPRPARGRGAWPTASIWPRRQRRGERTPGRRCGPSGPCFNLATTSASWRTGEGMTVNCGYGGFNLATTSASWRTPARSRRSRPPSGSFNLATTSASWRTFNPAGNPADVQGLQFGHDVSVVENGRPDPGGDEGGEGASIWPRRQRRGEPRRRGALGAGVPASIWPRRQRRGERVLPRDAGPALRRFNLATTSASWRTTDEAYRRQI